MLSDVTNAAIYLRQSLDRTGEGLAVSRQREDCLALCERKGWVNPVEYVDNDTSATKGRRPAYQNMIADIEAGTIDAVTAWDLDRLHRQPRELEDFITLCDQKKVALATVGGDTDLSTDQGRLTARIKGAVARNEIERKSARQKRALLQIAESGRGWGAPQFGYNGDHHNPDVVKDEARAIRKAYKDYLAGSSLYSIAQAWNRAGFRTRPGNAWTGTTVRRLLNSPRNMGLRTYRGEVVGKGDWPAIVDESTWEAVHYKLSETAHTNGGGVPERKYLLGGILRCGKCGHGLGSAKSYRAKRVDPVYKCKNPVCHGVSRKQERLDLWVRDLVLGKVATIDWTRGAVSDDNPADLHAEASAIRTQIDSYGLELAEGNLTVGQVKIATERLQGKLDDIKARLRQITRTDIFEDLIGAEDQLEVWESLDINRKRTLIETLCSAIVINPLGASGHTAAKLPMGTNIDVHWNQAGDG
ncbi:site-specific recombinase, DNA invertase Pin [Mycobacteroides abscessus subsp. abscessus]|nr:site-specific recombinase, DNA invertase Pin [Mycobacteroides abscessus subsp. abscessus]SKL77776.1 site-specific recombinase, DNA invertase Pin [Mycobacteroides abscessus subsp. abscessus]SKM54949.1 site-specific recombinase, DNA invertase Pin [Mycobacteroides abscessus subsp. abscessus]SLK35939.1 site-specific recombinase, DNA invertase Pin [Mycobacteroides abscessus subsp. abscessus]